MRPVAIVCTALVSLALAFPALGAAQRETVCARDGMPVGPAQASLREADFALARRACPRSEAAVGAAGAAIIRPEEFYGNARVAAQLSGSWAYAGDGEVFGTLEPLRYETVISSVEASEIGPGAVSGGVTQGIAGTEAWRVALSGRLALLGLFAAYQNAWPVGLDLGLVGSLRTGRALSWHGRLGALGSVALGEGASQPRAGGLLTAGLAFRPWSWLATVLDAEMGMGYAALFDVVSLSPALRFAIGSRLGIEFGGLVPVAGRERALAAALLRLSWRFDGSPASVPAAARQ